MPQVIIHWTWDEAFDKFGFDDGDGPNFTYEVANFLERNGYGVVVDSWGMHNTLIFEVHKDGVNLIPEGPQFGYDCPSSYLPADLVALLDKEFGSVSGHMDTYDPSDREVG